VDRPILALLGCFTISFYNINSPTALGRGLDTYFHLLAGMAMFYLIVNNVRRPEQLERLHLFQCVSIALVGLFGIFEITHPDGVLIPGWIEFRHDVSEGINVHNVRIGGPFFDFELLSEYCALNLLLVGLMLARARTATRRLLFGGRCNYTGAVPRDIAGTLRPRMERVFPQLRGVRIDYKWGGTVGVSLKRVPQFGCLDGNLWYAQGYSGHGIVPAHIAGRLLAEAIDGDAGRFDVFAKLKHYRLPGGRWFATPALALGMAWYRLRDLF